MKSNMELKNTKPTWVLSEDKLNYTKTFNEDITYSTPVETIYGNIIVVKIEIEKPALKITMNYEYNKKNNTVTAIMQSNLELKNTKPTWILSEDKFKQINDELKDQGFKKVALNLSEIDDNEYIRIDYENGSFSYQLPFTINIENTKKQLSEIDSESSEKIQSGKITIYENGLIEGYGLETYDIALDSFMEILQKLRRNI